MNINDKILSIPPYITTAWKNINALWCEGAVLVIKMTDGSRVNINGLEEELKKTIFRAYEAYLMAPSQEQAIPLVRPQSPAAAFRIGGAPGEVVADRRILVKEKVAALHQHLHIVTDGDHERPALLYLLQLMAVAVLRQALRLRRPLMRVKPDASNPLLLEEDAHVVGHLRDVDGGLPGAVAEEGVLGPLRMAVYDYDGACVAPICNRYQLQCARSD